MPKIYYKGEDGKTIASYDEDNDKLLDDEGKGISLKELKLTEGQAPRLNTLSYRLRRLNT